MTDRREKYSAQGGFTLLEVVVALAIVGVGVVTLLEILSGGMRLERRSSAVTEVMAQARQIMDSYWIRGKASEGSEEGFAGATHPWRLEVKPFVPETASLPTKGWELKEITLEIRHKEGGRERRTEIKTLQLLKEKNP